MALLHLQLLLLFGCFLQASTLQPGRGLYSGTRINSLIALFINYNFNFRIRLKNCCNLDKTSEPQTITKSTCIIMVILSRI